MGERQKKRVREKKESVFGLVGVCVFVGGTTDATISFQRQNNGNAEETD